MSAAGVLNTSIGSANLGDQIIMQAAMRELEQLLPHTQLIHFSSHDPFFYHSLKYQRQVSVNFLCGTNCLKSHMLVRPAWAINPLTVLFMKPTISIGVGWGAYEDKPDVYTRWLLRTALSRNGLLSVRDNYTKAKLEACGLDNVINTGCPTLWNLTPDHCAAIPTKKADSVVYTLTDYAADRTRDSETIRALLQWYEQVFVWLQGSGDAAYLRSLLNDHPGFRQQGLRVIPPSLPAYDQVLRDNDVDYVGTRLHGGIRAMQMGKRTRIIAVDNRAIEKGRDFNVPVIERQEIASRLEQAVFEQSPLRIQLPEEEIARFRTFIAEQTVPAGADLPFY